MKGSFLFTGGDGQNKPDPDLATLVNDFGSIDSIKKLKDSEHEYKELSLLSMKQYNFTKKELIKGP